MVPDADESHAKDAKLVVPNELVLIVNLLNDCSCLFDLRIELHLILPKANEEYNCTETSHV